jgi:phospholipase/carboxylesterase
MPLETLETETAPNPQASIVVLHGLGADGHDFVPITQELRLQSVGPVRFVFPHAPVRPVTINGGAVMRAWYDIIGNDMDSREDETSLRASMPAVAALIDRERERGIKASRIVLMGFSQGCAMTLLTGLRYPERLAGLVGLSGYLPLARSLAAERSDANQLAPIFLGHGSDDPVIPIDAAERSRDVLRGLGYDVQWHAYAMPHSVCAQEVGDLNAWLLRVLA